MKLTKSEQDIRRDRVVKAAIEWEKADRAFNKKINKKGVWRSILAESDLRAAVLALSQKP